MTLSSSVSVSTTGLDAGWRLTFRPATDAGRPDTGTETLAVSRDDYYGAITLSRATGGRAGSFEVTVEGLSDAQYDLVVSGERPAVFVDIELGWRDIGAGLGALVQDVAAAFGREPESEYTRVMTGRIREARRETGDFRYNAVFAGVEAAHHQLACTLVSALTLERPENAMEVVDAIGAAAGVPVTPQPAGYEGPELAESFEPGAADDSLLQALHNVARQMSDEGPRRQVPWFVAGDGLHFGPWSAPVRDHEFELTLENGLVEAKPVLAEREECAENPYSAPQPADLSYDVVLLGRPDIDVGDLVKLDVTREPEATPLAGFPLAGVADIASAVSALGSGSSDPDFASFRVVSLRHRLSRRSGFVTTLRVDPEPDEAPETEALAGAAGNDGDEAERTAAAMSQDREAGLLRRTLEVGEVRAQRTAEDGDLRPQRIDVSAGLAAYSGANRIVQAARADVPVLLRDKPYLTPFAFGQTGLVLPHYPGMRVATLHYDGAPGDAAVAGALWPVDSEPDSEPGDWWLSLPTGVSAAESIDDSRTAEEPSGPASHDLIDGDGGRVISVKGFRITIGEDLMPDVGTRPDSAEEGVLEITHESSNARIAIDANGDITIETDGNLTIHAGATLRLEGNKIEAAPQTTMEVE